MFYRSRKMLRLANGEQIVGGSKENVMLRVFLSLLYVILCECNLAE